MRETPLCVVGTVVSDVRSFRVNDDGTMKISFRMASNQRRFDTATGQWVDGDSLYLTVNCWRRVGLGVHASLVKGDPVIATGRLRTREWETKEGESRSVIELEATAVGPDLARCSAAVRRPRRDTPAADGAAPDPAATPEGPTQDEASGGAEALAELAAGARPLVGAPA